MDIFKLGDLIPLVQASAEKFGVNPALAVSILLAENTADGAMSPANLNKSISLSTTSPKGAMGVMQVMPATLQSLLKQGKLPQDFNFNTIEGQIDAGLAVIKDVLPRTGGNPLAVAAAYNGGNAGLAGFQGNGNMPEETNNYLGKIAKNLGISWSRKIIPDDKQQAVDASLSKFKATVDKNLPDIQQLIADSTSITAKGAQSAKDAGDAAASVAESAGRREVESVRQSKELLSRFGIDSQQTIGQLQEIDRLNDAVKAAKPQVDADIAAGSNPLDLINWLGANMRLMRSVPQYNALVQSRDSAVQNLATKQALLEKQRSLEPGVTEDTIKQEALSKAALAKATANMQAAKFEQENLGTRARFLSEEVQWQQQILNADLTNARMFMETLGIRKEENAKKDEQALLDKVNMAVTKYGGKPLTLLEFKAYSSTKRDQLVDMARGASTLGDVIGFVMDLGTISSLQQSNKAFADNIGKLSEGLDKDISKLRANPANAKLNDRELVEKALNARQNAWYAELKDSTYDKLSPDNPYRMSAQIYANAPGLENNPIAQYVKEDGSKIPSFQEKEILQYAVAQVNNGKPVSQVAANLEEFFRKGFEHQWKTTGMSTLGFDPKNPKWKAPGYSVSSDILWGFDTPLIKYMKNRQDVQLWNAPSIENFLTLNSIKSKSVNQGGPLLNTLTDLLPGMPQNQSIFNLGNKGQ